MSSRMCTDTPVDATAASPLDPSCSAPQPFSDYSRSRVGGGGTSCEDAAGSARECQPVLGNEDAPGSSSGSRSKSDSSELVSSEVVVDLGRKRPLFNMDKAEPGVERGYKGMLFGNTTQLCKFVTRMVQEPQHSGINTWDGLTPELDADGVLRYEEKPEPSIQRGQYRVKKVLKQRREVEGVFLCQDIATERFFVMKKIFTRYYILPGLKFLILQGDEARFLPKIYAVYKANNNMVLLYQEYIEGVMLSECDWTPEQILQFARSLLSACKYLHDKGLAHRDLKPANIMVRDPSQPDSLVIIDFESARVNGGPCVHEGQENTTIFLPPWYKELPKERFSLLQLKGDLWAVACILTCLLESSTWHKNLPVNHQSQLQELGIEKQKVPKDQDQSARGFGINTRFSGVRSIWAQKMAEVYRNCRSRHNKSQKCDKCQQTFLQFLETKGESEILNAHLGPLIEAGTEDQHCCSLIQVLEHLTNCNNRDHMSAATALDML